MIDPAWAKQFADTWIAAWNAHDLDKVLAHCSDDFEMTSPNIVQWSIDASGTLKGKDAVRAYWQMGLEKLPTLQFEPIQTLIGVNSLTLYYRHASGRLSAEVLMINAEGLAVKGFAHYGI